MTTIDQRPVVSWSGVLKVPSSATGTSTGAGAGGGLAPALPAEPDTGPSYVALTDTLVALLAVPWTGIAPFSSVIPSAGWSTVRTGASIWA